MGPTSGVFCRRLADLVVNRVSGVDLPAWPVDLGAGLHQRAEQRPQLIEPDDLDGGHPRRFPAGALLLAVVPACPRLHDERVAVTVRAMASPPASRAASTAVTSSPARRKAVSRSADSALMRTVITARSATA